MRKIVMMSATNPAGMRIIDASHPDRTSMLADWEKFRDTYEGGKDFVLKYLQKFSAREDAADFQIRQSISFCPAHAKAALNDIKNAIYQRLIEIKRIDGPTTYREAVLGKNGGVDRLGKTMTSFMGTVVLPELISIAKVGVFIDKDTVETKLTKREAKGKSPYIYIYEAEDILSWYYEDMVLKSLLLRDAEEVVDEESGLVTGTEKGYRHLFFTNGVVTMKTYDQMGNVKETINTNLRRIPFVIGEISQSLLTDVADYQIALLNLESSDLGYSLKSNFPFYIEQFNQAFVNLKTVAPPVDEDGVPTAKNLDTEGADEIKVGAAHGRRYPKGLEAPAFIHPSSEPLKASMEKGGKLKEDIRQLVNLSLRNLERPAGSQTADTTDQKGLEAGLSYIGMEMERIEKEISQIWSEYEGVTAADVIYPKTYSLKTDAERQEESKYLNEIKETLPSMTAQKEISKQIAVLNLETRLDYETIEKIKVEIDKARVVVTDHETIREDHKEGLVSTETASKALGYPDGEVEQAKLDHADRAARIALAQSKVNQRGVADMQDPGDGELDKKGKEGRGPE
jgi:hypothetical protein